VTGDPSGEGGVARRVTLVRGIFFFPLPTRKRLFAGSFLSARPTRARAAPEGGCRIPAQPNNGGMSVTHTTGNLTAATVSSSNAGDGRHS
jgi:hypothetical protein